MPSREIDFVCCFEKYVLCVTRYSIDNTVGEMGSVILKIECDARRVCHCTALWKPPWRTDGHSSCLIIVGIRCDRPSHSEFTKNPFYVTETFLSYAFARLVRSPEEANHYCEEY
jgi:hypothetical protein